MGLLAEHRDAATSLVADANMFAEAFVLRRPYEMAGVVLNGQIGDISALINPETGLPITGRQLTVVVSESALSAGNFDLDFDLDDNYVAIIGGYKWRACDRRRDRTLKLVTLFFEPWRE